MCVTGGMFYPQPNEVVAHLEVNCALCTPRINEGFYDPRFQAAGITPQEYAAKVSSGFVRLCAFKDSGQNSDTHATTQTRLSLFPTRTFARRENSTK